MPANHILTFPLDPLFVPDGVTATVIGPPPTPGAAPLPKTIWPIELVSSEELAAGTAYEVSVASALGTTPLVVEAVLRLGASTEVLSVGSWLRVGVSMTGSGAAWWVAASFPEGEAEAESLPDPTAWTGTWVRLQLVVAADQLTLLVGGTARVRVPVPERFLVPSTVTTVRVGNQDAAHALGLALVRLDDDIPDPVLMGVVVAAEAAGHGEVRGAFHRVGKAVLGGETSAEVAIAGGRIQEYEQGSCYWTPRSGGVALDGPVDERYRQLGAHAGRLGLPLTDTQAGTARYASRTGDAVATVPGDGSRMARFEHGAIAWSEETGAHEVLEAVAKHWLLIGGPTSVVGLPTGPPTETAKGYLHPFQFGEIFESWHCGPVEVHGAILEHYERLNTWFGPLGAPMTDETDVVGDDHTPTGARVSTFETGLITWTLAAGTHSVDGDWYKRYREHGGPSGPLGLPTSQVTTVGPKGVSYLEFERGLMVAHGSIGVVVVDHIDVTLSQAYAASIDDGLYWDLSHDRSAELFAFATVLRDGVAVDGWDSRRFPEAGHAGKTVSFGNALISVPVIPTTLVTLVFEGRDWDDHSHSEALGGITRTYGIDTIWGQLGATGPAYTETGSGGDGDVAYSYAIGLPTPPLSPIFREDRWWQFVNKGTDPVTYPRYAAAFEDVEPQGNLWDKAMNSLDNLFYLIAIRGVAKHGNCYGMSSVALRSMGQLNNYRLPLRWYAMPKQEVSADDFPSQLRDDLNVGQCRQLNGAVVGHVLDKLAHGFGNVFNRGVVVDTLAAGDLVVLSFLANDLSKGHAVLAYASVPEPAGGLTILVADPNVPFAADPSPLVSRVEVDAGGQWRFIDRGAIHAEYASMHGAIMMDIPGQVVRRPSVTPMAALAMGVESIVTSFVILGGEVRPERIGGVGGGSTMPRIPLLQADSAVQAFATSGPTPTALESILVATGPGDVGLYARSANVTAGVELTFDDRGVLGTITVDRFDGLRPSLAAQVDQRATTARLHLGAGLGPAGRAGWSARASVTVGGAQTATFGLASTGSGVVLDGLADGPAPRLELQAVDGAVSTYLLSDAIAGKRLEIQPADMASPFNAQVIRGLGSDIVVMPIV